MQGLVHQFHADPHITLELGEGGRGEEERGTEGGERGGGGRRRWRRQLIGEDVVLHWIPYRSEKYALASLVPRTSSPPLFDQLQYAITEGKDQGDLVTHDDIR